MRIIRSLLVGFVAILLVASVFGTVTGVSVEDESLSGESVAEEDAVEIEDWHDLDAVREDLDGDYVLMNDLDEDTEGYDELVDTEDGWRPIDTFTGNFDGNEYEISDLYIDRPNTDYVGLFGYIGTDGGVRNMDVVDVDVSGNSQVGVLTGGNTGTVDNSYATGDVSGTWYNIGGLVGSNGGTVSNSHGEGNVSGGSRVGGLVGNHYGTVENSYATGEVSGSGSAGGLVGNNWDGTVKNSYATGEVSGDYNLGGLVGTNHEGTILDSYATGDVSGTYNIGGLIGWNEGTVENTYATGEVSGRYSIGGLVGKNRNGTVENSFWNTDTSGIEESDGGTGKTTDEMVKEETFTDAGWDFEEDWGIIEGETYPYLWWQEEDTYPYPAEDDENIIEMIRDEVREVPGFTTVFLLLAYIVAIAIYQKKDAET